MDFDSQPFCKKKNIMPTYIPRSLLTYSIDMDSMHLKQIKKRPHLLIAQYRPNSIHMLLTVPIFTENHKYDIYTH